MNGILAAYTGTPFTVGAPGSALNAPGNSQTADQVGAVRKIGQVGPGTRWYDIFAFKAATDPGRFGTTGRNTLRSPGTVNADLSVFRDFPIKERATLSFRAEFFNFANHPQFGTTGENGGFGMASTDVSNPNFLRVLSAWGERQIRFGLRFAF